MRRIKFEAAVVGELKPDLFSRLIQWVLGREYSHFIWIVDNKWVYHTDRKGSRRELLKDVVCHCSVIRERVEVFPNKPQSFVMGYLHASTDRHYGHIENLLIAIAKLFPRMSSAQVDGRWSQNCSGYGCDIAVNGMGLKHPGLENQDFARPDTVIEALIDLFKNGKPKKIKLVKPDPRQLDFPKE